MAGHGWRGLFSGGPSLSTTDRRYDIADASRAGSHVVVIVVGMRWQAAGPEARRRRGRSRGWKFRRFQGPLLDVEVWVDGNKGEAYTRELRDRRRPRSAATSRTRTSSTSSVTRYERDDGVVRETVKLVRRLAPGEGLPGRRGQDRRRARADDQRPRRGVGDVAVEASTWSRSAASGREQRAGVAGRELRRALSVEAPGRRRSRARCRRAPTTKPKPGERVEEPYDPEEPEVRTSTSTTPKKVKIPERQVEDAAPEPAPVGPKRRTK